MSNFGSAIVGKKISQSVSVANTGNTSVNISKASVSNSQFLVSGLAMPLSLPAGQSSSFQVFIQSQRFRQCYRNSYARPPLREFPSEQVALSGTATQAPPTDYCESNEPQFGDRYCRKHGKGTATISNVGGSSLTISLISVSAGPFGVSGIAYFPPQLPPGTSATLNTTYAPTIAGSDFGAT